MLIRIVLLLLPHALPGSGGLRFLRKSDLALGAGFSVGMQTFCVYPKDSADAHLAKAITATPTYSYDGNEQITLQTFSLFGTTHMLASVGSVDSNCFASLT